MTPYEIGVLVGAALITVLGSGVVAKVVSGKVANGNGISKSLCDERTGNINKGIDEIKNIVSPLPERLTKVETALTILVKNNKE